MTTSLVPPVSIPPVYSKQLNGIHQLRVAAALRFAQETMNNRPEAAAAAYADYFEASVEYQLLWGIASAEVVARRDEVNAHRFVGAKK